MAKTRKPFLTLQCIQHLCNVDRYVRQYNLRGSSLREAASDVMDGDVLRIEIDRLVRTRLLSIIPVKDDYFPYSKSPEPLCGRNWTVDLTPRAIKIFWPERLEAKLG